MVEGSGFRVCAFRVGALNPQSRFGLGLGCRIRFRGIASFQNRNPGGYGDSASS